MTLALVGTEICNELFGACAGLVFALTLAGAVFAVTWAGTAGGAVPRRLVGRTSGWNSMKGTFSSRFIASSDVT